MRYSIPAITVLLLPPLATSLNIPISDATDSLAIRSADVAIIHEQTLERRRGGGGGGGRGGGSSGGSSSGGSSSGGSSSGGSSSGGSSSGGSSSGGSSSGGSSSGGSSGSGSGSASRGGGTSVTGGGTTASSPKYPGGGFAGGATSPYRAGGALPGSRISPLLLGGGLGLVGGALLFGGHPFYYYPYAHSYPYTDPQSHQNTSLPVSCVCAQYNPCGCSDTDNSTATIQQEISDGTANITTVNGTKTVVVNGTLENGTDTSGATALFHTGSTAVWPVALMVGAMIWGL